MSGLPDQDHYELLELARDATREEVERAYRMACATWVEGSLATYSVADDDALAALRGRVDEAYRVLMDVEARGAYDENLGGLAPQPAPEPELLFEEEPEETAPAELPAEIDDFEDLSGPDEGRWSGAALRRTRLARGLEIAQISEVTKVNPLYLRCIEEERFEALPAPVYVRGFVGAYARCLGLDAGRVANDYAERLQAARPPRRPRPRR
ncbi:MAG: helix-turn-helix domain-containing protein [Myxococcota bacterium]